MTLQAFYNDPWIKAEILSRLKQHRAADEIVQGLYWYGNKGCAVGCTVHKSPSLEDINAPYSAYEAQLGIPATLAHLEESIFEKLSNEDSKDFPIEFIEAIPVGADISNVWKSLVAWILSNEECGLLRLANSETIRENILLVAHLLSSPDKDTLENWRATMERVRFYSKKAIRDKNDYTILTLLHNLCTRISVQYSSPSPNHAFLDAFIDEYLSLSFQNSSEDIVESYAFKIKTQLITLLRSL